MSRLSLTCLFILVVLSTVAVPGCGGDRSPVDGRAEPVTLVVSAASDLRFAFQELGERFESETGTRVTFNFGSSGQLALQIEQGASVDVFASADVSMVEDLVRKGHLLPDTRALYARGFLILWTQEDGPVRVERIEDLNRPGIGRVSIANPAHAPYGRAAEQALRSAGLWERVEPKLVLGENVNQAFQFARTGNVDVGIIALSLGMVADGGRYVSVPQELHDPIDQALGVVSSTRHEAESRAFAQFVNGPVGRPLMERYGFALPGRTP